MGQTRVDQHSAGAGAIPRRISRGATVRAVRIISVCAEFQRPNVTHLGSRTVSRVQASGSVVTRQKKKLCVVPPGRTSSERSRFSTAWVASNSDGAMCFNPNPGFRLVLEGVQGHLRVA
jgi:hypothetical protein